MDHTGFTVQDVLLFAQDDPHITFSLEETERPVNIMITGEVSVQIPYQIIQELLGVKENKSKKSVQIWKKIRNKILG